MKNTLKKATQALEILQGNNMIESCDHGTNTIFNRDNDKYIHCSQCKNRHCFPCCTPHSAELDSTVDSPLLFELFLQAGDCGAYDPYDINFHFDSDMQEYQISNGVGIEFEYLDNSLWTWSTLIDKSVSCITDYLLACKRGESVPSVLEIDNIFSIVFDTDDDMEFESTKERVYQNYKRNISMLLMFKAHLLDYIPPLLTCGRLSWYDLPLTELERYTVPYSFEVPEENTQLKADYDFVSSDLFIDLIESVVANNQNENLKIEIDSLVLNRHDEIVLSDLVPMKLVEYVSNHLDSVLTLHNVNLIIDAILVESLFQTKDLLESRQDDSTVDNTESIKILQENFIKIRKILITFRS